MNDLLTPLLSLDVSPIAIAFRDAPPPGVAHIPAAAASSCTYWRLAAEGRVFYTDRGDQQGCAVGAFTHGALTPEKMPELDGMIKTMVGLEYLKMEEIPSIPHRSGGFGIVVYAPLAKSPVTPDVVLVRGRVQQMMLLTEAAQSAGVSSGVPTMGRPTCAVLPLSLESGRTAASFGCVGNRVYTGCGADEGYFAIPGAHLDAVVDRLAVVLRANAELEKFHQARAASHLTD